MVLVKQKGFLMAHQLNNSKIVMMPRLLKKWQKQEIVFVKKESDVGKEVVYGQASGEQIPNRHDDDQSVETSQMGNGLGETEGVSDGALAEPMKNRAKKSVDEAAETGNSIRENESDVRKEVVSGGASGEQIPNLHDDDQSVS